MSNLAVMMLLNTLQAASSVTGLPLERHDVQHAFIQAVKGHATNAAQIWKQVLKFV